MKIDVKLKYLDERIKHGQGTQLLKAKPGDAGFDVRACIDGIITIPVGYTELVPLGFAIHI